MEIVHYAKNVNDDYACGQRFGLVSSVSKQVTCQACKRVMESEPTSAQPETQARTVPDGGEREG